MTEQYFSEALASRTWRPDPDENSAGEGLLHGVLFSESILDEHIFTDELFEDDMVHSWCLEESDNGELAELTDTTDEDPGQLVGTASDELPANVEQIAE